MTLFGTHLQTLRDESAIAEEVLAEHEVRTISRGRELPRGFSRRQRGRAPGILFTIPRPNGEPGYSFRPDKADPENPGHKYEQPCKALGAPGNVLGLYETSPGLLRDASVTVVFTEGAKKGLSLLSAARAAGVELVVVVVSGVWNWLAGGAPIPDMLEVPVEGRKVVILFDSDMLRNPDVQDAARRLAEHLAERGAEVWVAFLRDGPEGSKTGVDDFFARGGTLQELRLLTRPYDPADFARIRLSRDDRLRLTVENLERRLWAEEWKGMGGHSARDVFLKLIEAARRHGKTHPDGIRVVKAQGPLAVEAKVSSRTLWKSLNRLEEWGLLYRDNEGRERDKAGAFVLRASVSQYEKGGAPEGQATRPLQGRVHGDLHLRAPRLRWSSPKYSPKRGTVRGTRKIRESKPPTPRPAVARLGKIRGAILDALDANGGTLHINELAEALHRRRARDLRRRNLPMLEEAGIVAVDGDTISLAEDWLDRLEEQRELGGEIEAGKVADRRYREKSRAYHNRHKTEPDHHYANLGADGWVEDLTPADAPEPELSPLAVALRDYLERNPHDAKQPPSWLGITLWAHDLYDGKPTPEEARAALEELKPKRRGRAA